MVSAEDFNAAYQQFDGKTISAQYIIEPLV